MKSTIILLVSLSLLLSCKDDKAKKLPEATTIEISDSEFVKDSTYKKGDVRRYGLLPNKSNTSVLNNIFTLAEQGLTINFPKGFYPIDLRIDGRKNMSIQFDDAIIGGLFQITEKDSVFSSNLKFTGNVTIYDKLFIRKSNNISFDNVTVSSNEEKNVRQKKNRGVSIYVETKTINFKKLVIENTGGADDTYYQYNAAALQIHGWNNNPEDITIDDLIIENSARTGLYLTGKNHLFKNVKISNFAEDSNKGMAGLDDAEPGTEKEFAAAWINKCNSCLIENLTITKTNNKGRISLKLDKGVSSEPTFINTLSLDEKAKAMKIFDDPLTNILIKSELEL